MSRGWAPGQRVGYQHYRRVLRPMVLERDGYQCQLRCPGEWPVRGGMARCLVVATQVHHTKGVARTGHDLRYMQAACAPCNYHVGDPMKTGDAPLESPSWL